MVCGTKSRIASFEARTSGSNFVPLVPLSTEVAHSGGLSRVLAQYRNFRAGAALSGFSATRNHDDLLGHSGHHLVLGDFGDTRME